VFVAANASIDRLLEVESLAIGAIHRPVDMVVVPGGKSLNAARAARSIGGRVAAIAIIAGSSGEWVAQEVAQEGIDVLTVSEDGETRTCTSILDRSTGRLTEFYEVGQALHSGTWDRLEAMLSNELARGNVGAVVVSGSMPPGAPPDGYARLLRVARLGRPMTLVDASGEGLLSGLEEGPTIVKLNATEAALTTGLPVTDAEEAMRAAGWLHERGAERVVVTMGERGAVGLEAGMTWRSGPPPVRGPYSVGSGDAFMAGLAVASVGGAKLRDAMVLGIAAGAANALVPGAGRLDPATVERLRSYVRLEVASALP
jgi:1-phosphofructokinase family hexose kinase